MDVSRKTVRQHGWALLEGAISPAADGCPVDRMPLWLSWLTKKKVFESPPHPPSVGTQKGQIEITASNTLGEAQTIEAISPLAAPLPKSFDRYDLPSLSEPKKRIVLNSIHYNPAAAGSGLYQAAQQMEKAFSEGVPEIAEPTPDTAIIVKPIWWPVIPVIGACVPVWNFGKPEGPPLGSYPPEKWPERVRVNTGGKDELAPGKTDYCAGDPPIRATVVSADEFFTMDLVPGGPDSQTVKKALVTLRPPGPVQRGPKAVLVGFHIISKEVKTWSWNTYWWEAPEYREGKAAGGMADGRPKSLQRLGKPWANYVMDSSLAEARVPAKGSCDVGAIYNPYQEAGMSNQDEQEPICGTKKLGGLASNCRSCHALTAFRAPQQVPITLKGQEPKDYFKNKTHTGFLWSLPFYEVF